MHVLCILALAWAAAFIAGCRSPGAARSDAAAVVMLTPLEQRIDAVLGTPLLVPVRAAPGEARPTVPVQLADGRTLTGRLFQLTVSRDPSDLVQAWLPEAGRWSAATVAADEQGMVGNDGRVLVLDLPADAFGQSISIGGVRLPLNWNLDPAELGVPDEFWRPAEAGRLGRPPLREIARRELLSPIRRWRYRLLADGLSPRHMAEEAVPFEDPVVEALARQEELRWSLALGMLWGADRDLAERLKSRLSLTIEFPGGEVVPAWPSDGGALAALRDDLLDPGLRPDERRSRAQAWLEALPSACAWIIDDAGLEDAASGHPVLTAGVANLLERDTVASANLDGDAGSPELRELPARSARTLTHIDAETRRTPGIAARPLAFNVGRWSGVRPVVTDAVPVTPPGLRIETLVGDWTLPAWLSGSPDAVMRSAGMSASILLHYRSPETGLEGDGGESGWWMYVECRGDVSPTDEVLIWLGAFGAPGAVLRITPQGVTEITRRGGPVPGARAAALNDRWIAHVPIRESLLGPAGILRLGVARTDGRGVRSAWPRPMLPWQSEPGRLAVDSGAWGAVKQEDAPLR